MARGAWRVCGCRGDWCCAKSGCRPIDQVRHAGAPILEELAQDHERHGRVRMDGGSGKAEDARVGIHRGGRPDPSEVPALSGRRESHIDRDSGVVCAPMVLKPTYAITPVGISVHNAYPSLFPAAAQSWYLG